jgi:hypothetical protein
MALGAEECECKMKDICFSYDVYIQTVGLEVSPVKMPCPSRRSAAPPPSLPMYTKDYLRKDRIDCLAA